MSNIHKEEVLERAAGKNIGHIDLPDSNLSEKPRTATGFFVTQGEEP